MVWLESALLWAMSAEGQDVRSGVASFVHIVDDKAGGGDRAENIGQ